MVAPTLPPPPPPLLVLCYRFTSAFTRTGRGREEEMGKGGGKKEKKKKCLSNKSASICLPSRFTFLPALFVRETENAGKLKNTKQNYKSKQFRST